MKELKVSKVFSHGIAQGPAFLVPEETVRISDAKVETKEDAEREVKRFEEAVSKVSANLSQSVASNPIFAGHLAILQDFTLHDSVLQNIRDSRLNAEKATEKTIAELKGVFESMDDAYMKERAADIVDVGGQLTAALQNRSFNKFADLKTPSIVIAKDLLPSDTALLDQKLVLGFITEEGGVTSHVSILAKSRNIPALVGAAGILQAVKPGDSLIMDAGAGLVYINPAPDFCETFRQKQEAQEKENARLLASADQPVVTQDGRRLKVYANVGNLSDVELASKLHVDGVGLFRSEFLYMENDHFPTEEEQFEVYRKAVQTLGHEMIIRTLDIGGDKKLCYYQFHAEENPFLGLRAIRLCLSMPEMFETQLRAILRASHYGPLRIMLPMLISVEEAERAKGILEKAKAELRGKGIPFDEHIPVGMMIETPAAILCGEDFAEIMDFFSIGTNDLTQYILAVDRGNREISELYNSFHPAVLRAIAGIIETGHKAGIEVGMCGEFAGNPQATMLLLGLGLDEFSMSAADTPRIKDMLRHADFAQAQKAAREILSLKRTSEIESALKQYCQKRS